MLIVKKRIAFNKQVAYIKIRFGDSRSRSFKVS